MYNKSYKGYKKKSSVFKKSYSYKSTVSKDKPKVSPEVALARLQIVKYSVLVLVVLIIVGIITAGFVIHRNENKIVIPNNLSQIDVDNNAELLRVVNKNTPLDSSYVPELTEIDNFYVNNLAVDSLVRLLDDADKSNLNFSIEVAYVSFEEQNQKYEDEYNRLLNTQNLTKVTAEAKAQATVPQGGKSEYQTGLLLKFDSEDDTKDFKDTPEAQWLSKHCIDYGFVLRYSNEKESKTLMKGDQSVYRFVGLENAKIMRSLNMCLDEYVEYISSRE